MFKNFQQEINWMNKKPKAQSKKLPQFALEFAFRRATAKYRSMANCVIIGAQKAGSSSLHYYLSQHPQVQKTFGKEIHYFDGSITDNFDTFAKGENWYRSHFPLNYNMAQNDICLDATPMYMFNPLVAKRMYQQIPNSKIIVLLRNPVERAISHYFHTKKMGWETLPIEQALKQESARLQTALDKKDYKDKNFRVYSYKKRGLYWQQIQQFLQYYPKDQFLFVQSEQLFRDPLHVLSKIYEFLNIDSFTVPDVEAKNRGTKNQFIPQTVYKELAEHFAEPNKALFQGIDEVYDW